MTGRKVLETNPSGTRKRGVTAIDRQPPPVYCMGALLCQLAHRLRGAHADDGPRHRQVVAGPVWVPRVVAVEEDHGPCTAKQWACIHLCNSTYRLRSDSSLPRHGRSKGRSCAVVLKLLFTIFFIRPPDMHAPKVDAAAQTASARPFPQAPSRSCRQLGSH